MLPPIALPDATGATVNLSDQLLAGNSVLLWLTGPAPDPGIAAALGAAGEKLAAVETVVFAVTPGREPEGIAVLHDPESRLPGAFGLDGPGMVLLDPERRLAAVLPREGGVEQAIAACARIHDRTAETVVRAQPPVIVIPDVADPALCRRLIDFWESSEKLADGVAAGYGNASAANSSIKRRTDVPVVDRDLLGEVSRRITRRVAPMIRKAFQRTVTRCETLRIGCYDSARRGTFARHRDNATPYTAHRLFAMSLNLNDGYAGGEVRFPEYGRTLFRPDPGDALVFSCALLHEVRPVRSGRRFGLFTFLYDEEGAEQERRMMEREKAAGRDPTTRYPGINA
jgi:predicted 2-oxoglutarate/Fe(II)-dependent dioxygenase YbiX